jgi:hypothetical protein
VLLLSCIRFAAIYVHCRLLVLRVLLVLLQAWLQSSSQQQRNLA